MRPLIVFLLSFLLVITPVKAVAPVLVFAATTSAGTGSVASASTTAVGLALTALALLSASNSPKFNFPTKGSNNTQTAGLPDPNTQATPLTSGSCYYQYLEVPIHGTRINPGVWITFPSGGSGSCETLGSRDVTSLCQNCQSTVSSHIQHRRVICHTNCSGNPNGSTVYGWPGAAQYEADTLAQYLGTTPNGIVDIERKGGSFVYRSPSDADLPANVGGETGYPAPISGGGMAVEYTNDQGQKTVVVTNPEALGTTITEYNQVTPDTYKKSTIQTDTQGVIQTGSQVPSSSGQVNSVPQTSPTSPVTFSPVTDGAPSTDPGTDPGTGTGSQIEFPSDYARSGEAAAAAQNVVDGLLSGEVVTPEVPDEDMPWFGSTFDGVLPTINTSGATCPVWQFDAIGESFYIDQHCQLILDFNALFYAMFTAFWVLLAFRTVLEA
jgi:hypothetical protein